MYKKIKDEELLRNNAKLNILYNEGVDNWE